ncbi:P-loop ATPase, Sll1717 family [Zhongshania arctica]|uniref:ATP-binding protein n=1 Tax=Zhongshania arctica TaxID=3238302 RepID=A0ABV3TT63_9GAMM
MRFSEINFEYTDAQEERIHAPELVDSAYVDINGITEEIFKRNKYLVYGSKGAGKSALASKLKAMSESRWDFFCEVDDLEEFEFNLLKKTSGTSGEKVGGSVTVWKLLLYIRIVSLYQGNANLTDSGSSAVALFDDLKKYGLLGSNSLVQVVQETSRKGLYSKFASTILSIQGKYDKSADSKVKDPAELVETIELALSELPNIDASHFLVLDGLDYLLRNGRSHAGYLADLVAAIRQVNNFFSEKKNNSKVIILFRDEVLDLVPDPNLTKRANDNGIPLDWYDKEGKPFDSYLLRVIENRAHLFGFNKDIRYLWKEWFPTKIAGKDSILFVLDSTRYLPRDLISFFRAMQSLKKEPPFTEQDVFSAINSYSEWFASELGDSLVGLVDEDVRSNIGGILSDIGPRFETEDFKNSLKEYGLDEEHAEKILSILFNTSWTGNVWRKFDSPRYAWKHRRKKAVFSPKKTSVVHNGLLKALSLR